MKTKKLNILFASLFAFVFLIGLASATMTLTPAITTLPQTTGTHTFDFTITSDVAVTDTINFTATTILDSNSNTITFTTIPSASYTFTAGESKVITMTYIVSTIFNFEFTEEYKTTLTATGTTSGTATKTISFEASNFCAYNNTGELKVSIEDIQVTEGFGEDDEWFAFDEIEVELSIENDGDEDVDNVVVEWGLYNTQTNEWTIEVDEEEDFNLNEGDEEIITITFSINDDLDEDLQDLQDGEYVLYVKATGEIADGVNEGQNACASDSESNNLVMEDDFVILNNFEVPESIQCDSEVQVLADAWNIGSSDQEGIYVIVYNQELGINEKVELGDIDAFDSSDFVFNFQLPEGVKEKQYYLTLTVYDEDDDVYENENDDKSVFSVPLNVEGTCLLAEASVTAVLESGGQAGREMIVKATILNTGTKTSTYSLNAAGYAEWASLATLNKTSLTLEAGKSEEVLLTFEVKDDALGNSLFNLEVLSENELVVSQPVQVEITKRGFGITGNFFSGDNKYIWGIGLLNLILIVLIIVIAVRISKR